MDCDDNPPFICITPTRTSRIVSQRAARNPPDFSRRRRPIVPRHSTEAVEDTGYLSIIYDYFIMTSTWGTELDRMTASRSERHLLAKRSLISTPPGLYRHTFPLWRNHQRRGHQYESHNRQRAIYTEIYIFTPLFYSASQNKNSLMHTPAARQRGQLCGPDLRGKGSLSPSDRRASCRLCPTMQIGTAVIRRAAVCLASR